MKIIIFKNCVIIDRGHLPFNSFWCFPMTWTNLILSTKQLISQNIQMKLCLFYLPVPNWGVIKDRKLFSQSSTTYSPKLKVFSFLWALSKLLYLSFSNFSSFFFFFFETPCVAVAVQPYMEEDDTKILDPLTQYDKRKNNKSLCWNVLKFLNS